MKLQHFDIIVIIACDIFINRSRSRLLAINHFIICQFLTSPGPSFWAGDRVQPMILFSNLVLMSPSTLPMTVATIIGRHSNSANDIVICSRSLACREGRRPEANVRMIGSF